MTNRRWYLIHVKARQETLAEMNLQFLGVETFCPVMDYGQLRLAGGQRKTVSKGPLFPGYLFVKVDISVEFRKVSYSHGVLGVVKFGSTPAMVEEEIIDSIKARGQVREQHMACSMERGQPVLIHKGPLRGLQAIFQEKLNGRQRVAILLKTLAYQGRVLIDKNCLTLS